MQSLETQILRPNSELDPHAELTLVNLAPVDLGLHPEVLTQVETPTKVKESVD